MRINFTRHIRITRLAALALIALFVTQLLEPRWVAASDDSLAVERLSMNYGKVSLGYGQTLRLHFTYAVDPARVEEPMPAIRAFMRLRDMSGNTIYISTAGGGGWKTINGGQTWAFDVNRDELALTGDQRTGALAVVPELRIEVPAGMRPDFPVSLEITDNLTGKLVFHDGRSAMHVHGAGGTFRLTFNGQTTSVARGETLLVNITNPLPLTLANQSVAAIDYMIKIKEVEGESNGERAGRIKPGQTIVARFNRYQFPDAGDTGTGRLSLSADITFSLQLTPEQIAALGQLPLFPVTMELEEFANGATQTTRGIHSRGSWSLIVSDQSRY